MTYWYRPWWFWWFEPQPPTPKPLPQDAQLTELIGAWDEQLNSLRALAAQATRNVHETERLLAESREFMKQRQAAQERGQQTSEV